MPYREVTMLEIKEALRLWQAGMPKKRVAAQLGMDPKTVRRLVAAAEAQGLRRGVGAALDDGLVAALAAARHTRPEITHGASWELCVGRRDFIGGKLAGDVRLSKICRLLEREGVIVPYSTLHRFAVAEFDFGRTAATVPVADCGPGEEVQLDTGWVLRLAPDLWDKRRRARAWIFTAVLSRHRFVWPCFQETTKTAIEACEAAWEFFGGVFKVVIPDNTKTIVQKADPLQPLINEAFLEYAQSRGFQIDTTRVRKPKDKARVERAVQTVRDDCFGGEELQTIEASFERARVWSRDEYGARRHTRTGRMPREHFDTVEKAALLPGPAESYDVPIWCSPVVSRDHYAQVVKALYTLPTRLVGKTLRARADHNLVRFFDAGVLVKTHVRKPPGGRATDVNDFPPEKVAYAMRDITFLRRQAAEHGEHVGRFAAALLDGPLPWTRMRQVYALRGLTKRYGDARVDDACATALAADMIDVKRLGRMLDIAARPVPEPFAKVIPIARFLRPTSQYALPLPATIDTKGDTQ
jgi:hypothetical protein